MPEGSNTVSEATRPGAAEVRRRSNPCLRVLARLYAWIRGVLALAAVLLIVLICTPVTDKLYAWLDVTEPPTQADWIVCLGGNPSRLVWTVDAYRRGFAPRVIVSNRRHPAHWMRKKLDQCGVPAEQVIIEPTSFNTSDHPHGIASLPGIDPNTQKFLVVTDHEHSRRVAACFRRAGFYHVTIYGSGFPLRTDGPFTQRCRWRILALPVILYEYTALLEYWLQNRI